MVTLCLWGWRTYWDTCLIKISWLRIIDRLRTKGLLKYLAGAVLVADDCFELYHNHEMKNYTYELLILTLTKRFNQAVFSCEATFQQDHSLKISLSTENWCILLSLLALTLLYLNQQFYEIHLDLFHQSCVDDSNRHDLEYQTADIFTGRCYFLSANILEWPPEETAECFYLEWLNEA